MVAMPRDPIKRFRELGASWADGLDAKRHRATRRHHDQRMKAKARRVMRLWMRDLLPSQLRDYIDNATAIGINAGTHCRPCSCQMCSFRPALGIKNAATIDAELPDYLDEYDDIYYDEREGEW